MLRRRRFELAAWEGMETAKPWREADADVAEAIELCEDYAGEMSRLAEPARADVPGESNETFAEPRGVAVVIAPWNVPLAILPGMTAAAVVAGNTLVMKPAEQSSVIAATLIFTSVGYRRGIGQWVDLGIAPPLERLLVLAVGAAIALPFGFGLMLAIRRLARLLAEAAVPPVAPGKVDQGRAPRRLFVITLEFLNGRDRLAAYDVHSLIQYD